MDVNADLGEGDGKDGLASDAALLSLVSSVNVACGFHAGSPGIMRDTVAAAVRQGVAIGAHPGYADRPGFGRRELGASPETIVVDVIYQVGALQAFCREAGVPLRHVKPHGALYHRAEADPALARALAEALYRLDPELALVGPAGGQLIATGSACGLATIAEAFVDRAYRPDGTLVPRDAAGAVLTDVAAAIEQAVTLVRRQTVTAIDGTVIPLTAHSLCVHGDSPHALALLRALRHRLAAEGITVAAAR